MKTECLPTLPILWTIRNRFLLRQTYLVSSATSTTNNTRCWTWLLWRAKEKTTKKKKCAVSHICVTFTSGLRRTPHIHTYNATIGFSPLPQIDGRRYAIPWWWITLSHVWCVMHHFFYFYSAYDAKWSSMSKWAFILLLDFSMTAADLVHLPVHSCQFDSYLFCAFCSFH